MRAFLPWTLVCLAIIVGQAWAQEDADAEKPPASAIRVAYLVAEGAPLHVRVSDVTVVSPAEPGAVSGFRLVRSGDFEVTILDASEDAAGGLGPASAPVLARATGAFEPGRYYTLVLIDRVGEDSAAESGSELTEATLEVHVFEDRLASFAGAGEARIRVVNLLPGRASWSAYGIRVADDRARVDRSADDEIRIAEAVPFAGAGSWVGVPMGIYLVRFEGESDDAPMLPPLEVAFHGGALYTAFVYPGPADASPRVAIRVDAVVRAPARPAPARPGDRR